MQGKPLGGLSGENPSGGGAGSYFIPDVLGGDVEEEAEQDHGEGGLDDLQDLGFHRPAGHHFSEGKNDMSAVQDGEREHVEDGEVDVEEDQESDEAAPAVFREEKIEHDRADADRAGKVFGPDA